MYDVSLALASLPATFTRPEALSTGLSDEVLARLLRRGTIVRLKHGIYANRAVGELTFDAGYLRDIRATALRFGPAYAVSHLSAAIVHGLPLPPARPGPVHLTRLVPSHRSREARHGVLVHHADSSETPVVTVGDLVVTSVERTIADCLRTTATRTSVPVADAAVFRGLTTLEQVKDYLEVQRRWAGVRRARQALALVDGRRETWLESYSYVRLDQLGVELPTPQVEVYDELGFLVGRVDGLWRDGATVAEMDGRGKYVLGGLEAGNVADAVIAEKVREDDIRDLGLEVVRWGLDDLRRRPDAVVRRIAAARRRGHWSRFRGSVRL